MRYLLTLALLLSAAAHSEPIPALVLTCSDENAIGQPQNTCNGVWAYQVPTNASIVSSGPYGVWRVFGDLISSDTVLVCSLPVEPGQYSSCRDASGARRTAFALKPTFSSSGRNSVIVSKTGGDYTDPVTAAENAFAGDTWCVAPQWPDQPCVMAIGDGVFILRGTLSISGGLAVSGNGKGDTLLVADNGVETAVSLSSNTRLDGLTIINSQPGGAQTTGVVASGTVQLHDAAIHVAGAAQNVAVAKHGVDSLEVLDSDITALGERNSKGIATVIPVADGGVLTLERSHVAASRALDDYESARGFQMRVVDSGVVSNFIYAIAMPDQRNSVLEIVRSQFVGEVFAPNVEGRVHITGSHIKGLLRVGGKSSQPFEIHDTTVEGHVSLEQVLGTFDRLQLLGNLFIGPGGRVILGRSYISSPYAGAAISVDRCYDVDDCSTAELEQTFAGGAQAIEAGGGSRLQSSSSVLAGRVSPASPSATTVLSCTDTYGADYELLTASCQPQAP